MLPDELEKKMLDRISECKQRSKELRKKAALEGKTDKIEFNEDNDGEKQAIALYKKAKRALANGNFSRAREMFEEAREDDDLPEVLLDLQRFQSKVPGIFDIYIYIYIYIHILNNLWGSTLRQLFGSLRTHHVV